MSWLPKRNARSPVGAGPGGDSSRRIEHEAIARHLIPDGALRDLYVQRIDLEAWKRALDAIVASGRKWTYSLDGDPADLPPIVDVFEQRSIGSPLLQVRLEDVIVNCHFFDRSEIEVDFSPTQVTDQRALEPLLDFMELVADAVGQPMLMTHENSPEALICEVRGADQVGQGLQRWFVWPDKIRMWPEFECWPLWSSSGSLNLNPLDLGLTTELAADLLAWTAAWDSTLDHEYPPNSGFESGSAESKFWTNGNVLASRVRDSLPGRVQFEYMDLRKD